MTLLKVEHLTKQFAGLTAVSDVSLTVEDNQLVGLIGPNGAGKTTLFNLLTGVYKPTTGTISLFKDGKYVSVSHVKPYEIAKLGIARTFQNIRLFKHMTVMDNLKVAMTLDKPYGLLATFLRLPSFYKGERKMQEKAEKLLKQVGLYEKKDVLAKNLPYGQQRKLEIARALATSPRVLFLDEPAAGMNPQETIELMALIESIKKYYSLSIVLIEHDMSLVMKVCEKLYVLDYGKLLAEGTPSEILNNQKVIDAYLGEVSAC